MSVDETVDGFIMQMVEQFSIVPVLLVSLLIGAAGIGLTVLSWKLIGVVNDRPHAVVKRVLTLLLSVLGGALFVAPAYIIFTVLLSGG